MASGPTIVAKFVADTSKMQSEVNSATSSAGSKIGDFAKKAAVAIGGAFAVQQVVAFGKASVDAAMADAEAQNKLATTIRNVTGATDAQIAANEEFISGLSKQTALADDDLRPAMDNLVRGFGDVESAQKALALATDVSAGTGKDLNTVTEAMMKAANGQTGALGRLGIATKNADGSAKSLDEIMASMSDTFAGQASESADTAAGRMRNAKIQFGEFQEEIGAALIPILTTLASIFIDTLLPAMKSVFGWIGDNADVFAALGIAIGVVGTAIFITLIPSLVAAIPVMWGFVTAQLALAAPWIGLIAVIALVTAAIWVLWNNWDTILNALKAAVDWVWQAIQTAWDAVVNATKAAFDWVLGIIQGVFNWIKDNWPLLLAIITGPIGMAVLLVVRNWDTIKNAVSTAIDFIAGVMGTVFNIITTPFRLAWDSIRTVWDWIKGAAQNAYDFMVGVFRGLGDAITAPIRIAWNALASVWNSTVGQVSVKIPDFVPGLGGKGFDVPDLPRLATGGVLTSPTLFLGGEAGTEIVAPEAMLRAIMREEGGGDNYTLQIYPRTADASDIAYGFRRLELLAGVT
ncbi:MAG TPA: hypothetical protein VJM49_06740 [Acidimicrobiales bacterium]|nr:hypothetical protein [Acidimicrobiales bacterium]